MAHSIDFTDKRKQAAHGASPARPEPSLITIEDMSYAPLRASLSLGFIRDGETTRLVDRDHFGPLLVQKPFYPEGREVCQVVVIHPPGGVVGGDQLAIAARIGAAGRAQITTPGAAKWYKANGHISRQNVTLEIGSGGSLMASAGNHFFR